MNTTLQLEPRKFYGYIPWYTIAAVPIIIVIPFLVSRHSSMYYGIPFSGIYIFTLWRMMKHALLEIEPDAILYNGYRVSASPSGIRRLPISSIKKIWIDQLVFPLRKSGIDAIFIETEDGKTRSMITLNQIKPKEREEIRDLVRKIQETIETNSSQE